ncbi:MAG: hypothetical protein V1894_06590 [Chloroflexota bacterium]
MDTLSKEELRELVEERADFCVSIYMPTHRTGSDLQQDRIRLKNLLSQAQGKLVTAGIRSAEAKKFLSPAQKTMEGSPLWQERADGLAMFISTRLFRYYQLPNRFEEKLVVGKRFTIKPLLPLVGSDRSFYLLAVSQNNVRLFRSTEYSHTEINLENVVPKSRREALRYDEYERQLGYHTRTTPAVGGGRRGAVYYGQGAASDSAKNAILRYFQQIDRGLRQFLGEEKSPLVFAGVDYLLPIYQEANTYQHLLGSAVTGNPDTLSTEKLHQQALKLVKPVFEKAKEEALAEYRRIAGHGFTSTDIAEIVPAAYRGRVTTLFLVAGAEAWGTFDTTTNRVTLHDKPEPSDQDLIDFAAVYTITQKGTVYTLSSAKLIDNAEVAATFRY